MLAAAVILGTLAWIADIPAAGAADPPLCDGQPATLVGTSGDDHLVGTPDADVIVGRGGNDVIRGLGGDDRLCGGSGRDLLIGGAGDDVLLGGRGADILRGGSGADVLHGHGGADLIDAGAGADTAYGGRLRDVLLGGPGTDDLRGGPGDDTIDGGSHRDLLFGDSGDDTLAGGDGGDVIDGGPGDDWIAGGSGVDHGAGGGGADTCIDAERGDGCEISEPSEDAWLGTTHAARFGSMMTDVLVLQAGCDAQLVLERAAVVSGALPLPARTGLSPVVEGVTAAAAHCDGDGADWSAAMDEALQDLADYLGLTPPRVAGGTLAGRARRAATGAVLLQDALYERLKAPGSGDSEFWQSFSHYGHAHDLTVDSQEGTRYDTLFIGSSMMIDAGKPRLFTQLDGRSAYNAGLKGIGPELVDLWLGDHALERADPSLIVYGIAPRDLSAYPDGDGFCLFPTTKWEEGSNLREMAFDPVSVLAGVPWEAIFFGDPAVEDPKPTPPNHVLYREQFHRLGDRSQYPPSKDPGPTSIATVAAWAADYQWCDARADRLHATIQWLRGLGIEVVVVAMPMSDLRTGIFGGREVVDAILVDIEAVVTGAGASAFLDYSRLIPNQLFRDITHVSVEGATSFTTALVGDLGALGL